MAFYQKIITNISVSKHKTKEIYFQNAEIWTSGEIAYYIIGEAVKTT